MFVAAVSVSAELTPRLKIAFTVSGQNWHNVAITQLKTPETYIYTYPHDKVNIRRENRQNRGGLIQGQAKRMLQFQTALRLSDQNAGTI